MKKILITGANGQLGHCFKTKSKLTNSLDFVFLDSKILDITNANQVKSIFKKTNFDYCINCAAYTAVDAAEDNIETATNINVIGSKNLAEACQEFNVTLIHISTDFVFDGTKKTPYKESDKTNPTGVYGATKLKGEGVIREVLENHYIIRTSWLYSSIKTIL